MPNFRYQALGPLTSGGGARAFLGLAILDDTRAEPIVLVWVPEDLAQDVEKSERIQRETERAALLEHPHIIRVYGFARMDDGRLARVVEFGDGENLRRVLEATGPLPAPLAARLIADAAQGVHYAHLAGNDDGTPLLHGDLRPETLLVTFGGSCRVSGYGAAAFAPKENRGRHIRTAPEQVLGGRAAMNVQTDVYLLGATLFEALTGKAPFEDAEDVDQAVLTAAIDFAQHPEIPEALVPVLSRALAKKAADRFPSALLLREAIELAIQPLPDEAEVGKWLAGHFPDADGTRAERQRLIDSGIASFARAQWAKESSEPSARPPFPRVAPVPGADSSASASAASPAGASQAAASPSAASASDASPSAASPTAASPTAASPTAASPTAASPAAASPTAASPTGASPTAASPSAASPSAASPSAASPTAASPTAASPTAASPTGASPSAASQSAASPSAASPSYEEDEEHSGLNAPRRRSSFPGVLLGVLAVGIAAAAAWWGLSQRPPPTDGAPAIPSVADAGAAASTSRSDAGPLATGGALALTDAGARSADAGALAAATTDAGEAADATPKGTLALTSEPTAAVEIDGIPSGRTPLRIVVAAGKRRVRLVDRKKGVDLTRMVLVPRDGTATETFYLQKGFVSVNAPVGAVIEIDGRRIGKAPLSTEISVYEGAHKVEVTIGTQKWRESFTVKPNQRVYFDVGPQYR